MRRDHAAHQSPGEAVGRHVLAGDPHALHARHTAGAETLLDLEATGQGSWEKMMRSKLLEIIDIQFMNVHDMME